MSVSDTIFKIAVADPFTRFCWDYLIVHLSATVREIKEAAGVEDWWPVKAGLEYLRRLGLVEPRDDTWRLTDFGRRVREVHLKVRSIPMV